MILSEIKAIFRNLFSLREYSLINIIGLSVGMAVCILIMIWVVNEYSYDKFHENSEQLYRVMFSADAENFKGEYLPGPLSEHLRENIPEITKSTIYNPIGNVKLENDSVKSYGACSFVEPNFFEMFSFPMISGDPQTVFSDPMSIVISKELAEKLFGEEDAYGKTIRISGSADLKITGVIENVPRNSHLRFDMLIPFKLAPPGNHRWDIKSLMIYTLLAENSSAEAVSEKIEPILSDFNPTWKNYLYLQPYTSIHLDGGLRTMLMLMSVLAALVLFIACFNFMNLVTACSEERLKEIGVRKVLGSNKFQISRQFLLESIVFSTISMVIAFVLTELSLPYLNLLIGENLSFQLTPVSILLLLLFALFTGILAGSYPAFYLSAFNPLAVLKGKVHVSELFKRRRESGVSHKFYGSVIRKIIIVVQFALTTVFIISVFTINSQLQFFTNKDLGYDNKHILLARLGTENLQTIKNELSQNPNILGVATSTNRVEYWQSSAGVDWEGKQTEGTFDMGLNWVDHDFLNALNLKMSEGSFFSREISGDNINGFVVNEEAVRAMNLENPVGKKISVTLGDKIEGKIIGVVKDFHTESMHKPIRPYALLFSEKGNNLWIRFAPGSEQNVLKEVKKQIGIFYPVGDYSLNFLDSNLENLYYSEQVFGKLINYICIFAAFISCLGLFGLSAFSLRRRSKEIGIRRVLGASVGNIAKLLSKEFVILIVAANAAAWPLAYIAMRGWLQNFAFRMEFTDFYWIFPLAGFTALTIALLTIGFQLFKAATSDPVKALKYE